MWGGWYDDPEIMNVIFKLKEIYDKEIAKTAEPTPCEVVFFADERGYSRLFSNSPEILGINTTRMSMGNTGVPYDVFMAEDAKGILKNYKAAVFAMPIASEAGVQAMELCKSLGIPFISATGEHYALSVEELCAFYKESGVHFYSDENDVVYRGNGYIALHSSRGGKKTLALPKKCSIEAVFGADYQGQYTDKIEFYLKENSTALFRVGK
jgi:beta-galactosidase